MIQALVTWLRHIPFLEKYFVQLFLFLRLEPLYVKVSVAHLLWGQRISLWEKMPAYFSHVIPNDTWFGLMYRVNLVYDYINFAVLPDDA